MYHMTIVLAHGVFDVIHHGHIAFLDAASKLGDELVVSITADEFVNKGPNRPVFTANQRAVTLLALESVDRVIVSNAEHAIETILDVQPDIYVKGIEYKNSDTNGWMEREGKTVRQHGGKVRFIDSPTDSSSRAINIDRPTIPEDAQKWVAEFGRSWKNVKFWLDEASKNSFSIAGERIIDRYEYVEGSGQSPKEGYTTYVPTGEADEWYGGATVIIEHVSQVGGGFSRLTSRTAGDITKTRYVQQPFLKKVFSVAEINLHHEWVLDHAENRIIADFGHGLFDADLMQEVDRTSDWIAATIQANSLNFGFTRIGKWGATQCRCDRCHSWT
jgi:rfaE bifunctional protein nucleotidyltransferase chain/domain